MSRMGEKDYYAILGVSKDASAEEIRRAFQQLARKLHPDINHAADAEDRFKEVSEAYAVLSDSSKRARYDAMRSGNPFARSSGPGSNQPYSGYRGVDYQDFSSMGSWASIFEIFGQGFGAQRVRSRSGYAPQEGDNVYLRLDLSAAEAKSGLKRAVHYERYVCCPSCSGKGTQSAEAWHSCPACGGSGSMQVDLSAFGFGTMRTECPECAGTGRVINEPCPDCGGSGRIIQQAEILIEVPANSVDGDVIRIAAKGNAGVQGGKTGDFVCMVGVEEHRLTQSQSFSLFMLGLLLPSLVLQIIFGNYLSVLFSSVVALFVFSNIWSARARFKSGIWLKRAAAPLVRGVVFGFIFMFMLHGFSSCSAMLGGY